VLNSLVGGGLRKLPIVAGVNDLCNSSDPCTETKEGDPEPRGAKWSEDHRERELASGCANRRLTCGEEEGEACGANKPNMEGPGVNWELLTNRIWCNEDGEKRERAEEGGDAD
jgi:hypothetical protein